MPLIASAPLETAPAVLEIGLLLLLAVAAGWLARRLGLPAVVGYLVVGLIVSPFTPGYVADRRQLQVLADVGVVLLLFEVDPAALPRALPWIGFLLAAVVVAKALPAAGRALPQLGEAMSARSCCLRHRPALSGRCGSRSVLQCAAWPADDRESPLLSASESATGRARV